jgi:hypothetical protein
MLAVSFAVATISLVRTAEEERLLRTALAALACLNLPVFITDGGSPEEFVSFLRSKPNFFVYEEKGLWPQARKSITEAAASGVAHILYTEPDKTAFFQQHLPVLLETTMDNHTGVVLASRSAIGLATFPAFQQMTEGTINHCCQEVIGLEADYCYGPFLFQSRLASLLTFLPENVGWGWRPALFAVARRVGLTVEAFTGDFTCPPDQQDDDETERIYRMRQLTQNIDGLVTAVKAELPAFL